MAKTSKKKRTAKKKASKKRTAKKKRPKAKRKKTSAKRKPMKRVSKPKKASKPTPRRKINKSEFIRAFSKDVPARQVVEAGKKKGLTFSQQLVYNVRAAGVNGATKRKRGRPRLKNLKADGADADFRQLVLNLGVTRSRELVDEVDERMREIVG